MNFVKGFEVGGSIFLESQEVTLVLTDGTVLSKVRITTAAAKKIGVTVEDENFERMFDLKEVATIK